MTRHTVLAVSLFCLLTANAAFAASFPFPPPLQAALRAQHPEDALTLFLGIPYRPDGMINDFGQYALFRTPDTPLPLPGLNCSGFVLAASRLLTRTNIPTADAVRDRLNDSGPASPLGHDWDFGFDLIMNIAEAAHGALVLPHGDVPAGISGRNAAAWDPHAGTFAAELFPRLRPGFFYLTSFSRHATPGAPARLHYHVGLICPGASGALWHYSTTRAGKAVIRLDLADPAGLAQFRHSFRNTKNSLKRLTIIAIPLSGFISGP